jgi:hypothetical protein
MAPVRNVVEQLERDGRPAHEGFLGPVVPDARGPLPPHVHGVGEQVRRRGQPPLVGHLAPPQDQVEPLPGPEPVLAVEGLAGDVALGIEEQLQVGLPLDPHPHPGAVALGFGPATGLDGDPHVDRSLEHPKRPQQLARRLGHGPGEPAGGPDHQTVGDPQDPLRPLELGDQHAGVGLVALTGAPHLVERDPEGTAPLGVEDRAEQRRRVETGGAEPVDGAVTPHEGRGGTVAEQAVVLDRQVAVVIPQRLEPVSRAGRHGTLLVQGGAARRRRRRHHDGGCPPRAPVNPRVGSVAVGGPVPGLGRQVVEAVPGGVLRQPLERRARPARDDRPVVGEVDGQAQLVHGRPGPGGGR